MIELPVVIGSTSDWDNKEIDIQGKLEAVSREYPDLKIMLDFASAHNTPDWVKEVIGKTESKVVLSAAGMSAALPGVIEAVHTNLERLNVGVPLTDKYKKGLPAFESVSEMPPTNPVLCAGIDNVVAGMRMAYHLEQGVGRVVLAHFGVGDDQYAKFRGKFEGILGEETMADPSKVVEVGRLFYVRTDRDIIPEEVKGNLVVTLANARDVRDIGAFTELDKILAETGGVHISLNTGEHVGPDTASRYARQFAHCKATGTMAVGSVGYGNAAQFAGRAMGWEYAMKKIGAARDAKEAKLKKKSYVIQGGQTQEIINNPEEGN